MMNRERWNATQHAAWGYDEHNPKMVVLNHFNNGIFCLYFRCTWALRLPKITPTEGDSVPRYHEPGTICRRDINALL